MALYLVTTLADEAFGGCETAATPDGAGLSLREALALANADPGSSDAITFAPCLKGGTLTLTQGELVISGNTSIDGDLDDDRRFDITIDADGASRGMHIGSPGYSAGSHDVSIDGLRITGGYAQSDPFAGGAGLLLQSPYGHPNVLTLTNCRLDGNTAVSTTAGFQVGALGLDGAAVLDNVEVVDNAASGIGAYFGTLQITNSTISNNGGHGIYAYQASTDATNVVAGYNVGRGIIAFGELTMISSAVLNNSGGGIFISGSSATIAESIIRGNTAENGAGIFAGSYYGYGMRIYDSIISENTASIAGGGIFVPGGGRFILESTLSISGSRIEGNCAPVGGGAFVGGESSMADARSVWLNNHATESGGAIAVHSFESAGYFLGHISLEGSLVAGNTSDGSGGGIANNGFATLTNVTVTDNSAGVAGGLLADPLDGPGITRLANTIVAGNAAASGAADATGPLELAGGNVVGGTATVGTTPVRTGITPEMVFDQSAGAPPGTLLADRDNPALDAGDDSLVPGTTDLAGDPRLVDLPGVANNGANVVDLGAYELQALPTTITVYAAGESFRGNPAFSLYADGALVAANVAVPSPAGPHTLPELRRAAVPFEFEVDGPVGEVAIVFANNALGPGGDRDLFIREVDVDELTLSPKRHGDFDPDGPARPSIVNAAENHGLIHVNGTLTLSLPEDTLI